MLRHEQDETTHSQMGVEEEVVVALAPGAAHARRGGPERDGRNRFPTQEMKRETQPEL